MGATFTAPFRRPLDFFSTDGRILTRGTFEIELADDADFRANDSRIMDVRAKSVSTFRTTRVLTLKIYAVAPTHPNGQGRVLLSGASITTGIPAAAPARSTRPLLSQIADNLEHFGLHPQLVDYENPPDVRGLLAQPILPDIETRPACAACGMPVGLERDTHILTAGAPTCSATCNRRLARRRHMASRKERGLNARRPSQVYHVRRALLGRYLWPRYKNPHAEASQMLYPLLQKIVSIPAHRERLGLDKTSVPQPLNKRDAYLLGDYLAQHSRKDLAFERWLKDYLRRKTARAETPWLLALRRAWSLHDAASSIPPAANQ